ncbi:hypothetical protein RZE82_06535 [Mollicutes bacterium LVI A0039]|nr:hypothetical protein RZE82_06535 [Mollicutes bacterium LVI A0039]
MYYIYMFGSVIVSLLLILFACIIPIFVLKEFDKMTYVKGYRKNLKWYKKPFLYLQNLLVCVFFILSIGLILIVIISQSRERLDLLKKQAYAVYSSMFITPLVGVGFSLAIAFASYKILYILELDIVSLIFVFSYVLLLLVLVPIFLIFSIKQLINIYKIENKQLEEQYPEFCGGNKKETIKLILLNQRRNQYVYEYLKVYDTVDEWKKSKYFIINYNIVPKLIGITILLGYILNILVSVLANEIFARNVFTLIGVVIMLAVNFIIILNYMLNASIFIDISQKIKLSVISILKLVILSVTGVLITLLVWNNVLYFNISNPRNNMTYQEYKAEVINVFTMKNDYLNYSTYEKINYISKYIQYFKDDLESLEYMHDKYENILVPIDNYEIINFLQLDSEEDLYLYINIPWLYITDSEGTEIKGTDLIIENNEDFTTYDSETKEQEYEENNGDSYKYLANNEIEKIIKEEAVSAIDSLWDEEMEDRELI